MTHHWRVRGADRNKTPDTLRVALAVTDTEHGGFHLDTLDLCQAKARAAFIEAAVAELHTERAALVRELAEVLFATEAAVAARDAAAPVAAMTEAERAEAMELLADPDLAERVVEDLGALGVVGEETNLLVAYLATISRKAERPFGVVVQSSTAAGKSTLGRRGVPAGARRGPGLLLGGDRPGPLLRRARPIWPTRCWPWPKSKGRPGRRTRSSCW